MKARYVVVLFAAVLSVGALARGETLVNTFGTGDSFDHSLAWGIWGPSVSGGPFWQAFLTRTLLDPVTIASADVAVVNYSGSKRIDVQIMTDAGSERGPGSPVAGGTSFVDADSTAGVKRAEFSGGVYLQKETFYWLVLSCGGDGDNGWCKNDQAYELDRAYSTDRGSSWTFDADAIAPAMRLNVVPEPSTLAGLLSLGAGALMLGWLRRRRS